MAHTMDRYVTLLRAKTPDQIPQPIKGKFLARMCLLQTILTLSGASTATFDAVQCMQSWTQRPAQAQQQH